MNEMQLIYDYQIKVLKFDILRALDLEQKPGSIIYVLIPFIICLFLDSQNKYCWNVEKF